MMLLGGEKEKAKQIANTPSLDASTIAGTAKCLNFIIFF